MGLVRNGKSKVEGVSVSIVVPDGMPASVGGGAAIYHPAQQSVSQSGAPPVRRGANFLAGGLQCIDLGGNAQVHRDPPNHYQRDGGLADHLVVVEDLRAERRTSLAERLNPSTKPQRRPRRDRCPMLDANGAAHHHFNERIDVLLHLPDADGFEHRDQVAGRQAFDHLLRVRTAMR